MAHLVTGRLIANLYPNVSRGLLEEARSVLVLHVGNNLASNTHLILLGGGGCIQHGAQLDAFTKDHVAWMLGDALVLAAQDIHVGWFRDSRDAVNVGGSSLGHVMDGVDGINGTVVDFVDAEGCVPAQRLLGCLR